MSEFYVDGSTKKDNKKLKAFTVIYPNVSLGTPLKQHILITLPDSPSVPPQLSNHIYYVVLYLFVSLKAKFITLFSLVFLATNEQSGLKHVLNKHLFVLGL